MNCPNCQTSLGSVQVKSRYGANKPFLKLNFRKGGNQSPFRRVVFDERFGSDLE